MAFALSMYNESRLPKYVATFRSSMSAYTLHASTSWDACHIRVHRNFSGVFSETLFETEWKQSMARKPCVARFPVCIVTVAHLIISSVEFGRFQTVTTPILRVCVCVYVYISIKGVSDKSLSHMGVNIILTYTHPRVLHELIREVFFTVRHLSCSGESYFFRKLPSFKKPWVLSLSPSSTSPIVFTTAYSFLSQWNRLHNITRSSILIFCSQLYHCFPRDLFFYTTFHKIWFQLLPALRYIISVIPTRSFR